MPYIAPEVITEAKRMDLLTYLREYEPGELVKFSSNTYTTRTHDSLKISNGKWMWWSRGIGGKSALDYLIKVRGMDFVEAVQTIMGNGSVSFPTCENIKSYENQPLLLPEKSPTTDVVFDYLFGRGIDYEIINYCLEQKLIIESLPYHNAVFIGYDENKEPKYAAYRATKQSGELFFIWTMILPEEKRPKRCRRFFQISMKSLTTLPNMGKMSTTFFVNAWE